MARFLLTATPFAGHVVPMLALAGTLVGRGHQVRFYTGEKYAHLALEVGCDHVPMRQAQDFDDADLEATFPKVSEGGSLSSLLASVRQVFFSNGPGQARDLIAAHRSVPVDALIGENMCFGTGLAHEMTGVPWASVTLSSLPFPTTGDPRPGTSGPSAFAWWRGRVTGLLEMSAERMMGRWNNQMRAQLGLGSASRGGSAGLLSDQLVVAQGIAQLEPPRRDLPEHLHLIGDLSAGTRVTADAMTRAWIERLRDDGPVVHVTEGTLGRDRNSLVQRTVQALEAEAQIVIGGRHRADGLPASVIDAGWVPHDLLLPKVDVMITNGGYGAVLAALGHGVPLLVVPGGQEKPFIARRVAASGAGRSVPPRRATPQRIRSETQVLLSQVQYRDRAHELAEALAAAGGSTRAAMLVEQLVRTGGQPVIGGS